jgi:hypothetical protein
MTTGGKAGSQFRDQFAVEPIGDEGVLINLSTGGFFHLNPTATKACLALQGSTSPAEAADLLAASMALTPEQAASLLIGVRMQLAQPGVPTELIGPFRYRRQGSGYALEETGRVVLTMDPAGRKLRLHAPPDTLTFKLMDYVRAVTPKLLHLRGVTVLHASACLLPQGLTAFSGKSGAGKTTTARAFAGAGARLISEDLVVLTRDSRTAAVVVDGERRAHEWAAATADALGNAFEAELDCDGLAEVSRPGPEIPLAAIWFVDRSRREGPALRQRPFTAIDGALALLANNFLGSDTPESWRRHVRETHAIARQLALWEVTMPDGLGQLAAAARAYATNTAS